MMWHEARKQERKIRGMLVDYKKRAERRKDYYEKIVSDFLVYFIIVVKVLCNFISLLFQCKLSGTCIDWLISRLKPPFIL